MTIDFAIKTATGRAGNFRLGATASHSRYLLPTSGSDVCPDVTDLNGNWCRLLDVDDTAVAATVSSQGSVSWTASSDVTIAHVKQSIGSIFTPIVISRKSLSRVPPELAEKFAQLSPVVHISSATLGEALIKAIIRQVVSAPQAKRLLSRLIVQYGLSQRHESATYYGFPSLRLLAELPVDELVTCGFGYKASVIRNVARDFLDRDLEAVCAKLPHDGAVRLLQSIKGIGPWSAHIAVCDYTADWSLYPFGDLAVRTWASRLWQGRTWPTTERSFYAAWLDVNGTSVGQITCYLLTLGRFYSQQGDTPRQDGTAL